MEAFIHRSRASPSHIVPWVDHILFFRTNPHFHRQAGADEPLSHVESAARPTGSRLVLQVKQTLVLHVQTRAGQPHRGRGGARHQGAGCRLAQTPHIAPPDN
eukprot:3400550-Prymnesium_polylepis.1